MPQVSPSVLIIRLDAIGDALALTPAIAALRQRAIPVDVVLRSANEHAFASRAVRDVIVAAFELRSNAPANLREIERLGGELRGRDYSHVLVATEDAGGYRLAAAVDAPVRIGFEDVGGKPFKALWSRRFLTQSIYRSARLTAAAEHECETLFRLVAPLLGQAAPTRDLALLRPLVLDAQPPPGDRVAVQVTDKWERLGIRFEEVAELVRRLGCAGELNLISSRNESRYAQRLNDATGLAIEYFDDTAEWKAAIAAAPAIVAPDSGALHVAGMVGTPIVAVFPDDSLFAARVARWAPWAAPHRVVRALGGWTALAADALAQLL
ncbi:MAG TPA: glycosyltransferase family 9 protein [Candidatus Cybelea sp.]|jgi:ADP-heptose:LPS heptosyltransferase|nr:glycosyltransferase family 9 protein [Candidatus Cybelea sp.]